MHQHSHGMQEMKDALQSTADENGRLHERLAAEARKQDGLQDELAKSRSAHAVHSLLCTCKVEAVSGRQNRTTSGQRPRVQSKLPEKEMMAAQSRDLVFSAGIHLYRLVMGIFCIAIGP